MKNIDYAWLQISDLHIFDNIEWSVMQEAYKRLPYQEEIRFIIVTGDLHQYKTDYEKTKIFLEKLLDLYNLTKKDIFIVPGNHDSGDCKDKEVYTYYIENNVESMADCYRDYFVSGKLVDCFKEYNKFIKEFYKDDFETMYLKPEQVRVITWNNKINIIHLNTAINCNGNNQLQQIVDVYQLSNLYEKLNQSCPSILIAHHPFHTIHESHKTYIQRFITDWKISAYLCGDSHKKHFYPIQTFENANSNIPCIICGKTASENLDAYSDLGCIIYIKEKNKNKVTVYPYLWNSKKKKFSDFPDLNTDEGNLMFPLLESKVVSSDNVKKKYSNLVSGESIWLKDAEKATGSQSRFGDFTSTSRINDFIRDDTKYWGLSAVKGIGKTFVLQIKRSKISKNKLCLPIGIKPSSNNGWGTDTIILETQMDLEKIRKFENVVLLWRYSISVYAINQLYNVKNEKNSWKKIKEELENRLKEFLGEERIHRETFQLCTRDDYSNLSLIMKRILTDKDWMLYVQNDTPNLIFLKKRIEEILDFLEKKSLVILIDKVDQAMDPVSAEMPINCEECKKLDKVNTCTNPEKSSEYCSSRKTTCKIDCCYGCEKYLTPYSNTNLRIYGENVKKYRHINIWQYLQLGLILAVSKIKTDFNGLIEVYFAIREEAFSCETGLLGEHARKIVDITQELWYTKEEHKQIFYDCIKFQQDEFLYNPVLKKTENRLEDAFVGVSYLCHPYVLGKEETIFDCIYRHSFDRTRDIQEYGEMLTKNMQYIRNCNTVLERGEEVKKLIENKAAELAFSDKKEKTTKNQSYYVEKIKLLPNYWSDSDNFKSFILIFTKNLMFGREAREICKQFNCKDKCANECKNCNVLHHPFSILYKLGMVGRINMFSNWRCEVVQDFIDSKDVTYIKEEDMINLNEDTIYMLHPALTKSIEHMGKKLKHFRGFIIGKGEIVSKESLDNLINDYKSQSEEEYENKYFAI